MHFLKLRLISDFPQLIAINHVRACMFEILFLLSQNSFYAQFPFLSSFFLSGHEPVEAN